MAATATDSISNTITTLKAATDQYNIVKDDASLREAFHAAGGGLLLVKQALEAANTQLAGVNLAGDPERARNLLEACNNNAKLSESIFKAVAEAPETSRLEYYKGAVKQQGQGRMVEDLVKEMMNGVCALAENNAIKEAMKDQVTGLRDAIQMLSNMDASVPTEGSGDTYNHWGSGDMMNAPGGRAIKNDFNSANISGPMNF